MTATASHLALMHAASIRTRCRRAEVRREIANLSPMEGRARAAEVLADPDPACEGMSVYHLLVSCRRIGPSKATSILVRAGVHQHKRLGDLTDRQKDALERLLCWRVLQPNSADRFASIKA